MFDPAVFAARRAELMAALGPNAVAVVRSLPERLRNGEKPSATPGPDKAPVQTERRAEVHHAWNAHGARRAVGGERRPRWRAVSFFRRFLALLQTIFCGSTRS